MYNHTFQNSTRLKSSLRPTGARNPVSTRTVQYVHSKPSSRVLVCYPPTRFARRVRRSTGVYFVFLVRRDAPPKPVHALAAAGRECPRRGR